MGSLIIAIIAVSFTIWSIIAVANSQMEKQKKAGWFAVVILIPILGPILYYFFGK